MAILVNMPVTRVTPHLPAPKLLLLLLLLLLPLVTIAVL
jgi:hypothetical protein